MQLHESVEKRMLQIIQTQEVYEHWGGTHTPLDRDTELQTCIRKSPAIFQIACT